MRSRSRPASDEGLASLALDQEIGSSVDVEIESVGLAIKVECAGCGLCALLSASGLRLPPYTPRI
jgi:hypothetical protein